MAKKTEVKKNELPQEKDLANGWQVGQSVKEDTGFIVNTSLKEATKELVDLINRLETLRDSRYKVNESIIIYLKLQITSKEKEVLFLIEKETK